MEYQDKDGDRLYIEIHGQCVHINNLDSPATRFTPDTARAIALELIRLADEIDPGKMVIATKKLDDEWQTVTFDNGVYQQMVGRMDRPKHGKRYLTRDWKVVHYDGTQDVVARVWRNKPGRFAPDEMVFDVAHKSARCWPISFDSPVSADKYSNLVYYVRVSDLPDDMKGGPKP